MPVSMPKLNAPSPIAGIQAFIQMFNAANRAQLQKAQTQRLNIQNQYMPQLMQEQITRAQIQNQFAPLMQQEQLRQMGFRNAFQELVNKWYPDLTAARIEQMGRTGQFAGMPPLARAYQMYQNYSQMYGENDTRTTEAKKIYDSMMNSAQALTNQRNVSAELASYRATPSKVREAMGMSGVQPQIGGNQMPMQQGVISNTENVVRNFLRSIGQYTY